MQNRRLHEGYKENDELIGFAHEIIRQYVELAASKGNLQKFYDMLGIRFAFPAEYSQGQPDVAIKHASFEKEQSYNRLGIVNSAQEAFGDLMLKIDDRGLDTKFPILSDGGMFLSHLYYSWTASEVKGGSFSRSKNAIYIDSTLINPLAIGPIYNELLKYRVKSNAVTSNDVDITKLKQAFYNGIKKSSLPTTLIHELQHAYDYARSDGKFSTDSRSKEFYDPKNYDDTLCSNTSFARTMYLQRLYYQLPHEYWARMSEFLKKTRNVVRRVSAKQYLVKLPTTFVEWDSLEDADRKRLYKAAYQYWQMKNGKQ
jgi:hypothetical protein